MYRKAVYSHSHRVEFCISSSTTISVSDSKFFMLNRNRSNQFVESIEFEKIIEVEKIKKIKKIKLMKCDAEGSEYAIFTNPKNLLHAEYLLLELHATAEFPIPEESFLYCFIENHFEILSKVYPSSTYGKKLVELFCLQKTLQ